MLKAILSTVRKTSLTVREQLSIRSGTWRAVSLCTACVVAIAYVSMLALAVRHELLGTLHPDASIYLTIGRGIVNGLTLYTDLFDFKPPGIFLLAALSIKLTGGIAGLMLSQTAVLLAIPLLAAWASSDRLWGVAYGIALGLFLMRIAGNGGGVESFGSLFGSAYVVVIRSRWRLRHLIAAALVSGAVLMKEPFALAIAAASLVLFPLPKELARKCLLAAAGSLVLWIGFLAAFQLLDPYFNVYLPYTFGMRVTEHPLLRGLQVWKLLFSTASFSLAFSAIVLLLLFNRARRSLADGVAMAVALYLASTATLLSSAGRQHPALAVPFFLALFISQRTQWPTKLLLLVFPLTMSAGQFEVNRISQYADIETARVIDRVMDDCGLERYMYLGNIGPFFPGYMRHSPLGPAFFISDYTARVEDLVRSYEQNLEVADLIVFERSKRLLGSEQLAYDRLQDYVIEYFVAEPWPCGQKLDLEKYVLLYRKRDSTSETYEPPS